MKRSTRIRVAALNRNDAVGPGSVGRWPAVFGGPPNTPHEKPRGPIWFDFKSEAGIRRRAGDNRTRAACVPHSLKSFGLITVLIGALVLFSAPRSQSAPTKAATPPPQKPNVLFIAIDDLNDWIGALGKRPQFIAVHPVYTALGGIAVSVAFPQLEAIPPGHPSPLDEMGQVGRIIRQGIARGLAKVAMNNHHPLPKFLGGDKVQNYIRIPTHVHNIYHKVLDERLKAKGFPLGGLGGSGNSAADWARHFDEVAGSQQKAFEAILEAAVDIDATFPDEIAKTGTTMTKAAWQMIIEGKFN